jgi:hypothetical protein
MWFSGVFGSSASDSYPNDMKTAASDLSAVKHKIKSIKGALDEFNQVASSFESALTRLSAELAAVLADAKEQNLFSDIQTCMVKQFNTLKREIDAPLKAVISSLSSRTELILEEQREVEKLYDLKLKIEKKINDSAGKEKGSKLDSWTRELDSAAGKFDVQKRKLVFDSKDLMASRDIELSKCCLRIMAANFKFISNLYNVVDSLEETKYTVESRLVEVIILYIVLQV